MITIANTRWCGSPVNFRARYGQVPVVGLLGRIWYTWVVLEGLTNP